MVFPEIGAVVFTKIIHFRNALREKFIFAKDKRDSNGLIEAILVCVNIQLHFKVWVVVIVEIFI